MTHFRPLRLTAMTGLVTGLAIGLAGCSGGSGAVGTAGPANGAIDTVRRDALNSTYRDQDFAYHMAKRIEGHAVRTSGTATYNGVAAIRQPGGFTVDGGGPATDNADLVAEMAMTVDFGSDDVTASLWDFHDNDGARAGGSVQLAGEHEGGGLTASGSGTLDWGDHHQALDIEMDGWLLVNEVGARGRMGVTSTIDDEVTTMEGRAILINDNREPR